MAVMDYSLVQRIIDGTGQILDTTPGSPDSGSYVTEAQLRDWIKAGILFSGYYYNGNFYSDSGHTSPLAKVEGALYVDKTNSNKALYVCLSSTYQSLTEEAQVQAIIDGLNDGTIVPLKAKQDQNGNVIDTTYETKADANDLKNAIAQHEARIENLEEAHGSYHEVDVKSVYTIPSGKGKNWLIDKLKGVQRARNQLVTNPQFAGDSTTGWTPISVKATISATGGVGKITASVAQAYMQVQVNTPIDVVSGHKYLVAIKMRMSSSVRVKVVCSYFDSAPVDIASPTANTWYYQSAIVNGASTGSQSLGIGWEGSPTIGDTIEIADVIVTDLTLYFNGTIPSDADSIAEIQTIYPWLLTPSSYGTSMVKTRYESFTSVGVNIWNEVWRNGYYNGSTGAFVSDARFVASTNPIPVIPNKTYALVVPTILEVWGYDYNGDFVGAVSMYATTSFTVPSGVWFIQFNSANVNSWTTYTNNAQICDDALDSSIKTTYHPYSKRTLSLPTPIELGSAGSVADTCELNVEVEVDGQVVNKFRTTTKTVSFDLGTISGVTYESSYNRFKIPIANLKLTDVRTLKMVIDGGYTCKYSGEAFDKTWNMVVFNGHDESFIYLMNQSKTGADITDGKALWLSGVDLVAPCETQGVTLSTPLLDNLIPTEGGGTLEAVKTYPIDDSFTVGYLTL